MYVFAAFVRGVAGSGQNEQQLMPHQSFEEPLSVQVAHRRPRCRAKPALFLDFTSFTALFTHASGNASHARHVFDLFHNHMICRLERMSIGRCC